LTRLVVGAVHLGNESAPGIERVRFALRLLERAAEQGCTLAVLPELAWSNLATLNLRGLTEAEVMIYDEAVKALRQFARHRGCCLVAPILPPAPGGGHYNGAVVIDQDGCVSGVAHKHTLPSGPGFDEAAIFVPGSGWLVAQLAQFRLGILVCADRREPDHWRALADQGADTVAVLMAGLGNDVAGMVLAELRTYARLARLHAVMACRAGEDTEGGFSTAHHAESCVVTSDGSMLGPPLTTDRSDLFLATLEVVGSQPAACARP